MERRRRRDLNTNSHRYLHIHLSLLRGRKQQDHKKYRRSHLSKHPSTIMYTRWEEDHQYISMTARTHWGRIHNTMDREVTECKARKTHLETIFPYEIILAFHRRTQVQTTSTMLEIHRRPAT